MSRFHGKQDFTGPKDKRPNKGVLRGFREVKREEAQERQASSDPRKSRAARLRSTYVPASHGRVSWDKYPALEREHEITVVLFLTKNPELADA